MSGPSVSVPPDKTSETFSEGQTANQYLGGNFALESSIYPLRYKIERKNYSFKYHSFSVETVGNELFLERIETAASKPER